MVWVVGLLGRILEEERCERMSSNGGLSGFLKMGRDGGFIKKPGAVKIKKPGAVKSSAGQEIVSLVVAFIEEMTGLARPATIAEKERSHVRGRPVDSQNRRTKRTLDTYFELLASGLSDEEARIKITNELGHGTKRNAKEFRRRVDYVVGKALKKRARRE